MAIIFIRRTQRHTRRTSCDKEGMVGNYAALNHMQRNSRYSWQPVGEKQGTDSLSGPLRRNQLHQHIDFRFMAYKKVKE
jgi:hypothetical protein